MSGHVNAPRIPQPQSAFLLLGGFRRARTAKRRRSSSDTPPAKRRRRAASREARIACSAAPVSSAGGEPSRITAFHRAAPARKRQASSSDVSASDVSGSTPSSNEHLPHPNPYWNMGRKGRRLGCRRLFPSRRVIASEAAQARALAFTPEVLRFAATMKPPRPSASRTPKLTEGEASGTAAGVSVRVPLMPLLLLSDRKYGADA